MKIGKFAELHNVTQDTIRHYLELGLLVAEKKGGQYHFRDSDSSDMKKIIELKALSFSLNEIQKILAMQRISGERSNSSTKLFLGYLEKKKKETEKTVLHFNNLNNSLKEKINEIKHQENKDGVKLGFSLSSLQLLECPQCHRQLTLSEGIIERNNVIEAVISCDCGFAAEIKEGIYVDRRHVRMKLLNGKRMPSKEEYLASSSAQYNNFMYKGMACLAEKIEKHKEEPKYIMELDNCVGFFLMQYIKSLPSYSTYILIDYDYERILNLKRDLENYYNHNNFIFLCCEYDSLPLKSSFVDIVIDYKMTFAYEENTGKKLYDMILPFIKKDGIICGAYTCDEKQQRNYEKVFCSKEKMLKLMDSYKLRLVEATEIGPFTEESNCSDKQSYEGIYVSKKSTLG